MSGNNKPMISVDPEELRLQFELEKQSHYDLKVSNNTEQHVAFKVKTTSPKKYFVHPNTGVIHPWGSCIVKVTLQVQREYPRDMQCNDKFLLQSTIVSVNSDVDDLPQDTFNKDGGKAVEECKLKVVCISSNSSKGTANDEALGNSKTSLQNVHDSSSIDDVLQLLTEERDAVVRQRQQLQQELDMLKRRKQRKGKRGFSFKFALFVALTGTMRRFLLEISPSSPASVYLDELLLFREKSVLFYCIIHYDFLILHYLHFFFFFVYCFSYVQLQNLRVYCVNVLHLVSFVCAFICVRYRNVIE